MLSEYGYEIINKPQEDQFKYSTGYLEVYTWIPNTHTLRNNNKIIIIYHQLKSRVPSQWKLHNAYNIKKTIIFNSNIYQFGSTN